MVTTKRKVRLADVNLPTSLTQGIEASFRASVARISHLFSADTFKVFLQLHPILVVSNGQVFEVVAGWRTLILARVVLDADDKIGVWVLTGHNETTNQLTVLDQLFTPFLAGDVSEITRAWCSAIKSGSITSCGIPSFSQKELAIILGISRTSLQRYLQDQDSGGNQTANLVTPAKVSQ